MPTAANNGYGEHGHFPLDSRGEREDGSSRDSNSISGIYSGRRRSICNSVQSAAKKRLTKRRASAPAIVPDRKGVAVDRVGADPRISDHVFTNDSIRILIDYLDRCNFDHVVDEGMLKQPGVYQKIILFLIRQLEPKYKLDGKLEDEFEAVLRCFGYPYQITSSWPSLFVSIMWLLELLLYDEKVSAASEAQQVNDLVTDTPVSEKVLDAFLETSYALFMSGEDDQLAECEENFVGSYETGNSSIRDQIAGTSS